MGQSVEGAGENKSGSVVMAGQAQRPWKPGGVGAWVRFVISVTGGACLHPLLWVKITRESGFQPISRLMKSRTAIRTQGALAVRTAPFPGLIEWKPAYSIGIAPIDSQHQLLVSIIRNLQEAMLEGRAKEVVITLLGAMNQ